MLCGALDKNIWLLRVHLKATQGAINKDIRLLYVSLKTTHGIVNAKTSGTYMVS